MLLPSINAPAFRLKGELKVLAPLKASTPVPCLVKVSIPALCKIGALMTRPVAAKPAWTVSTGSLALNSREVPEMTGTETGD